MEKIRKQLINTGHLEGISYLILLGIAMPLKYWFEMPMAVRIVGSLHGLLFIAFCFALFRAYKKLPLTFGLSAFIFLLSFVPFGTFFIKRYLVNKNVVDYLNI